ncbi:MAG TPA: hypothetical protein VK879_02415 [Candidatus Sulfomarinibacteraceae bacterium]|nr:hypothetical protein [Candidatus Sulfomarinibacteraceae bacterium]
MSAGHIDTYFDQESGHVLLQLRKVDVGLEPAPVEFKGKTFWPKDEVHITIIGSLLGAELARILEENPGLVEQVREVLEDTPWSYRLLDEWYHVVREEGVDDKPYAESIIRMAQAPAIESFYERLRALTGLEIAPRPTHVTLYTYDDDHGIGVATWEQFEQRVVQEVRPEQLAPVG